MGKFLGEALCMFCIAMLLIFTSVAWFVIIAVSIHHFGFAGGLIALVVGLKGVEHLMNKMEEK